MWTLSGFADEIDPDLDVQLQTLAACGIAHLELRGVWGKNVLALSDAEVDVIKTALAEHGVKVSAIGSPIGKIGITDDFAPHLVQFRRALDLADDLGAPYVRIFSFFIPSGDDPADHRAAVISRLEQFVRIAEERGVTLAHENERHIYGETPERCHSEHDRLTAFARCLGSGEFCRDTPRCKTTRCRIRPAPTILCLCSYQRRDCQHRRGGSGRRRRRTTPRDADRSSQ